jgi:conjugal transfer pilus assembly protein TraE
MKLAAQEQDLAALRGVIARQSAQLLGLLGVLALALVTVLLMVGRERTVLTPPTLQKSFWVEGDQVSGAYLEQMAGWIATLILDVSPGNIDYNKTILLQYAAPDAHGALAQAMELAAARLKRDNATTLFAIQQLTPDEPTLSVVLKGRLATFINDKRVADTPKTYLAAFRYSGGRIQITTFKEADDAEVSPAAAMARGLVRGQ